MLRLIGSLLILGCSTLFAKAPDSSIEEGDRAYQRGSYLEAMERYREIANDDRWPELQAAAQDRLGRMLAHGEVVARNTEEALLWLGKSTALGNTEAPSDTGDIYFFAQGVPQDLPTAAQWYQTGVDRGSTHGMMQLAWCYLNGMGVSVNVDIARQLYIKAAQLGSGEGAFHSGWMFEHIEPIDYQQAMAWFLKAATRNYAPAKNNIGYMYERGLGVKKDYAAAANWYKQAAEAGEMHGQYHLGILYEQGLGITRDREKAIVLMRASAASGYTKALEWLASRDIRSVP